MLLKQVALVEVKYGTDTDEIYLKSVSDTNGLFNFFMCCRKMYRHNLSKLQFAEIESRASVKRVVPKIVTENA